MTEEQNLTESVTWTQGTWLSQIPHFILPETQEKQIPRSLSHRSTQTLTRKALGLWCCRQAPFSHFIAEALVLSALPVLNSAQQRAPARPSLHTPTHHPCHLFPSCQHITLITWFRDSGPIFRSWFQLIFIFLFLFNVFRLFFLLFLHLLFLLNDGSVYKETKLPHLNSWESHRSRSFFHTANLSAGSQRGRIIWKPWERYNTLFRYSPFPLKFPAIPRNLLDDTEGSQGVFPKC